MAVEVLMQRNCVYVPRVVLNFMSAKVQGTTSVDLGKLDIAVSTQLLAWNCSLEERVHTFLGLMHGIHVDEDLEEDEIECSFATSAGAARGLSKNRRHKKEKWAGNYSNYINTRKLLKKTGPTPQKRHRMSLPQQGESDDNRTPNSVRSSNASSSDKKQKVAKSNNKAKTLSDVCIAFGRWHPEAIVENNVPATNRTFQRIQQGLEVLVEKEIEPHKGHDFLG